MSRLKDSWDKAKILLSQLLCIGAVFTACTDDEVINQTTKALQVSVSTEAPAESRAIIDGGYLPDGASIGVTLTAEDGSAYDGQAFTNLQYTAAGEGSSQAWSSATPASLSITNGKVIAYYPYYGGDDFDLKAVPVETASQTDYMYAKPVTGINIVSPAANLTMQHAMTDIRINVKKGTYTGTGEVTKITAKAPAFATSATMDVETGVFTNVSGGGAQFMQELSGAAISSGNVVHEFLIVPDAQSTSGDVAIFVIIDGKKFAVTVPYTECFQQGFAYTYNLTLDNAALTLDGVSVAKWGVKAEVDESLQFVDDQYVVEIAVPSDGYKYIHNIDGFIGTIDWGDGTISEYTTSVTYPTHNYNIAGNYTVIAEGKIEFIESHNFSMSSSTVPSKIITKLLRIGKEMKVSSMNSAFYGQTLLSEIVPGALDGCTEVTDFYQAFRGCTNLTSIPEGLFDKCTEVTNFERTFNGCTGLTEIPVGLFDKCTEVKYLSYTFYYCQSLQIIPEGLFDKCTNVENFTYTFYGCKSLTTIPSGLFDNCTKVIRFESTFEGCTGLKAIPEGLFDYNLDVKTFKSIFRICNSIQKIPEGLFDKCTKVTDFYQTFSGCTSLTTIPEGLFDKCTEVTSFASTFSSTAITSIPEGLFDYNNNVSNFSHTFDGCTALQTIPEGLFDSCTEVSSFDGTFYQCSNLTEIPIGLFDYNTKVTSFDSTFKGIAISSIPERLFDHCTEVTSFSSTFNGCTNLTSIPEGLFDKCTKAMYFSYTFQFCASLTGESPYTIINVDGQDVKVHLYERANYPEYFTAPTGYDYCYRGCSKLTDYIPSNWK